MWRLKPNLTGLKRFMPDHAVQWALAKSYGWPRHYEPVCDSCPHITRAHAQGAKT